MTSDPRTFRLKKLFDDIIKGTKITSRANYTLFLEAICHQADPTTCVSKVTSSSTGLASLQSAMRCDLSSEFFNGAASNVLTYLQDPSLQRKGQGSFLDPVVMAIVEPPIFWNAFLKAFQDGKLGVKARISFAWLLLRLVSLPGQLPDPYRDQATELSLIEKLESSSSTDVRSLGHKIRNTISSQSMNQATNSCEISPGGRHDNDFVDFCDIAILPTAGEITSIEPPFLRTNDEIDDIQEGRLPAHLDNQFRLLREDMLYEIREELQMALGKKKGRRRGMKLDGLIPIGLHFGEQRRRVKWGIQFKCVGDFPQLKGVKPKDRRRYLTENRQILQHGSLTGLLVDNDLVAFPVVNRDEDLLSRSPPILILQFQEGETISRALMRFNGARNISLVQANTAIFAYGPVLRALQRMSAIRLESEILYYRPKPPDADAFLSLQPIIHAIRSDPTMNLQSLLDTPKPIGLGHSQAQSLLAGLSQRVALIQGPPGTGKSFIGALLAKVLHKMTSLSILVVCYTDHALDDILTGLMDVGIPEADMVRLGGKSVPRTENLSLSKQADVNTQQKADWNVIDSLRDAAEDCLSRLQGAYHRYSSAGLALMNVMNYLEFEEPEYFEAFQVPQDQDGTIRVGKKGGSVNSLYLIHQWVSGWNAGIFSNHPIVRKSRIWRMSKRTRQDLLTKWRMAIVRDQVEEICGISLEYNGCLDELASKRSDDYVAVLKGKRIIGCTTTAAAKYSEVIQAGMPGILLVEEASEILESHILAAIGKDVEKLILIGDHKQRRPKVQNHRLTVEKGEGFGLNVSLFERLILKDFPHSTLSQQHRMRPEISALIRHLTYPELVDAPETRNRPDLRGVQDNIVFINHSHEEGELDGVVERRDASQIASKYNKHEISMILKIVRYLEQQGYGTEELVILTPYLAQLHALRAELQKDNDPILNDLDSFDLAQAGLVSPATAKLTRKPICLATIDNYQGEESDIVIVSLTSSNATNDIGFILSQERLNIVLSRARNALIMIGNSQTFMGAGKGKELWRQLFSLLKEGNHIYDGFPIQCDRHPNHRALLEQPQDFESSCLDGGCLEPCGVILSCDIHSCPSKCHQIADHSKMKCEYVMYSKCDSGHSQTWQCHQGIPLTCSECERQQEIAEQKQKEDFQRQQEHQREIRELEDKVKHERDAGQEASCSEEHSIALWQKEKDLEDVKARSRDPTGQPDSVTDPSLIPPSKEQENTGCIARHPSPFSPAPESTDTDENTSIPKLPISLSEVDWKLRKEVEGASNDAIDAIMGLVGLEEVKKKVLEIYDKVQVTRRQGVDLRQECFNVVFLGNPGTGKTTVARHYAKFLRSLKVLPGSEYVETTGARMANDGVPAVKSQVGDVLDDGGGAIFIDEAYQLTAPYAHQGRQVLDFLLAEMENNVGKIVFILAGYSKEMEKFFEHNPGLSSRVPYQVRFEDYNNSELHSMFASIITKRFNGQMKVERGIGGLFSRIVIARLGRQRGRPGFGNARALHSVIHRISGQQAARIEKERRNGQHPDDFLLTKEDLIGPEPLEVLRDNPAWEKLQKLTGLDSVKQSVKDLMTIIETNYHRELDEKSPLDVGLNRVFLGSPGTGKTTVAKLYGQILADLKLLSNGEVVVKNPADFVGSALGQSEANTKAILAATAGKVLVIDEAYMLHGGGGEDGKSNDTYKTAVIDTIVAEVQSVPGEDRCVLLLGYKEQIERMFQHVNPGLARRFAIENAFHFQDFTDEELREILNSKLKDQHLAATDEAKNVAIDVLSRLRARPNFGNAGAVENLISQAKTHQQARTSSLPPKERANVVFLPQDFDPKFDRGKDASANLAKLFEDVVGCDDVVKRLEGYQKTASRSKDRGLDMRELIPTNFIFKGPPGTGKTTVARKMGQVYYDMGFLSSSEVVECSASELVGQYVGQTGPKTKALLKKALGRVLFIDEAYRLCDGSFAKEAIDELVAALPQPEFLRKIIVILAGYDDDIDRLLMVNAGLSSRFPEHVIFTNITSEHCLEVLRRQLEKKKIHFPANRDPSSPTYTSMRGLIEALSALPSWGNARDIETLSKKMINVALIDDARPGPDGSITLRDELALDIISGLLRERRGRSYTPPPPSSSQVQVQQKSQSPPPRVPSRTTIATSTTLKRPTTPARLQKRPTQTKPNELLKRDPGVPDDIWQQLQKDRKAADDTAWKADEAKKKQEARAQAKLRQMGVCVAGYTWIKQASGYRCAGGTHFVSNEALRN